jgi:hypothetical protein
MNFTWLGAIPRWVIYLVVLTVVSLPLVRPIGLPIFPGSETHGIYDTIETLPGGSVVVIGVDYEPLAIPELSPMVAAVATHALSKGHRVIAITNYPSTPAIAEKILNDVAAEGGYQYGVQYANLGYAAGQEAVVLAAGRDFKAAYPRDFRGSPTAGIPLMQDVNSWRDVAYMVDIAQGATADYYFRIAGAQFGLRIGVGTTAVSIPHFKSYLQSGQINGLLGGLQGAAEYEALVGRPAFATAGMDAQSMAHLAILALVVLGNVSFFIARRARRKAAAAEREGGR